MQPCEHYNALLAGVSPDTDIDEKLQPGCGFVGCSRDANKHALEHYKQTKHALSVDISSKQVWCYACDDYVYAVPPTPTQPVNQKENKYRTVGLENLGNTCYMNAALQIMLNSPSIRAFFTECASFVKSRNQPVSLAFMGLCGMADGKSSGSISPYDFVRLVKNLNPMFGGYGQQDSMDFMRFLWDRLHEELAHQPPENDLPSPSPSKIRKSERFAKATSYTAYTPKARSIISDTFGGVLRSRVECTACGGVSVKDDPFFDLSLPIPSSSSNTNSNGNNDLNAAPKSPTFQYMGNVLSSIGQSLGLSGKVQLEDCLRAFCAPERLDGREKYFCEHCKSKQAAVKTLKIKQPPNVLCLQLKRFKHESFFSSKVNTAVAFPEDLVLDPFLVADDPIVITSGQKYELMGVIHHMGGMGGGHYIAFAKPPGLKQWHAFNDSIVGGGTHVMSVQAYILFYRLRFDPRPDIASTVSPTVFVSKQWIVKYKTLARPGAVDSSDISCEHGNLKVECDRHMAYELSTCAIDRLERQFGWTCLAKTRPVKCEECSRQIREWQEQRRREAKDVECLDTRQLEPGEQWHIVDGRWLQEYRAFQAATRQAPPGKITNDRLLAENGQPKPGLQKGTDYRAINPRLWSYLHGIYGGGPVIKRTTTDIYSGAETHRLIGITIPRRIVESSSEDSESTKSNRSSSNSPTKRSSPRR